MANQKISVANLPVSVISALIVTALLFIAIPLLTKISTMHKKRVQAYHVLISKSNPAPPPEPEKEQKLEEVKKEVEPEAEQRRKMPTPKLNIPTSGLSAGIAGTIQISGLLKQDLKVSNSLFVTAFNLNEVDQPPRLIRAMNPRYPFEAQQKGVSGRVMLRFVVDKNGQVQEPEVVQSEPKGVFDEAALEACKKYKFRPAMKGGKPVDCIVKVPIKFSLNE